MMIVCPAAQKCQHEAKVSFQMVKCLKTAKQSARPHLACIIYNRFGASKYVIFYLEQIKDAVGREQFGGIALQPFPESEAAIRC